MKVTGRVEKWLSVVLGVVCLILVVNLVLHFGGTRVGASRPNPASGGSPHTNPVPGDPFRNSDGLSRYDPQVKLDLLKELESRQLPELTRSPFEYVAPPAPMQPGGTGTVAAIAQPPAPPPISLKALGYAEKAGGVREGYVADQEQLHVVHEGDSIGNRFKVLKITPRSIEVEDGLSHETIQLPVPQ